MSHPHPLKRPTSSSVNPKLGTSSLSHVPYVQCQRPMCDVRASSANGPCAMSVRPVPMAHPRCPRTDPPRDRRPASPRPDPLTSSCFLGHRLSSQTNTSLFCTLCPHSCAPGKNFPVGHPSPNFSGPSTLNFGVFSRSASGKEVATC